jgi:hypothetical protein
MSSTLKNNHAWFGHTDQLPEADIQDALVRLHSENQAELDWRMHNYRLWRCGYGAAVRRWRREWMQDHEEAIETTQRLCKCLHDWKLERRYDDTNKILGTYDRGNVNVCTKCNEREYVRTSYNNWSGD